MKDRRSFSAGFIFTVFIVTAVLFIHAVYVQYPMVFSDEAVYALHSKFLNDPRFPATRPNILYFYAYHLASRFGTNHLIVVKLLNAAFFGASLFPLYATARTFVSKPAAYLFSLGVVFSPISSYSVYEMPESMYFFIFWTLVYIVVVQLPRSLTYGAIYSGLGLAALSAVKPHGLILIATVPIVLVCLYLSASDQIRYGQLIRAILLYLAAFVIGRLIINYVVLGNFLVSLFGSYYAKTLTPSLKATVPLLPPGMWFSMSGHLSYLAVLFWPAILLALWPSEVSSAPTRPDVHYVALLSFSFAALVLLIAIVAKYTVDVTGTTSADLVCRLYGRYYNFVLGTLVLLFLARMSPSSAPPRWPKIFAAVVMVGAIASAAAAYFKFADYCPNLVDFPEVMVFSKFRSGFVLVILGSLGSATAVAFLARTTARLLYLSFIGTLAMVTSVAVFVGQVLFISPPPTCDLAAIAVRDLVPDQINDGMVLARDEDARSFCAMFQLYSLSEQRILDKAELTAADIPPGKKWALLLDPYILRLPYYSTLRGKDFQFVEFAPGGMVARDGARPE